MWANETNSERYFDPSTVKWLAGGDSLVGRGLYSKRHVRFTPSHTLLLITNNKPHVTADDNAFWSRVILVPFTATFVNNPEHDHEYKIDKSLPEKLRSEAGEILTWLVTGCIKYQREGLVIPEKIRAVTDSYRYDEDIPGHFIEECCVVEISGKISAGELYKGYSEWCERNGHTPCKPHQVRNKNVEAVQKRKMRRCCVLLWN